MTELQAYITEFNIRYIIGAGLLANAILLLLLLYKKQLPPRSKPAKKN